MWTWPLFGSISFFQPRGIHSDYCQLHPTWLISELKHRMAPLSIHQPAPPQKKTLKKTWPTEAHSPHGSGTFGPKLCSDCEVQLFTSRGTPLGGERHVTKW